MPPAYPFHLYPFHYTATFKIIEDGWSLFQPEEEFAKIINSSSMDWRISYVNIDYSVSQVHVIQQKQRIYHLLSLKTRDIN